MDHNHDGKCTLCDNKKPIIQAPQAKSSIISGKYVPHKKATSSKKSLILCANFRKILEIYDKNGHQKRGTCTLAYAASPVSRTQNPDLSYAQAHNFKPYKVLDISEPQTIQPHIIEEPLSSSILHKSDPILGKIGLPSQKTELVIPNYDRQGALMEPKVVYSALSGHLKLKCEICDVVCSPDQFSSHANGPKHKKVSKGSIKNYVIC